MSKETTVYLCKNRRKFYHKRRVALLCTLASQLADENKYLECESKSPCEEC